MTVKTPTRPTAESQPADPTKVAMPDLQSIPSSWRRCPMPPEWGVEGSLTYDRLSGPWKVGFKATAPAPDGVGWYRKSTHAGLVRSYTLSPGAWTWTMEVRLDGREMTPNPCDAFTGSVGLSLYGDCVTDDDWHPIPNTSVHGSQGTIPLKVHTPSLFGEVCLFVGFALGLRIGEHDSTLPEVKITLEKLRGLYRRPVPG